MFFRTFILFSSFYSLLFSSSFIGKSYDFVWPKFHTKNRMILTNGKKAYAYNFLPKGENWILEGDTWFSESQDFSEIVLNPEFEYEGEKTFVFHGEDKFPLIHELFHPHQQKWFLLPSEKAYPALYHHDNQALMKIEELIVEKYVRAEGVFRKGLKEEFLLVRQYRNSLLDEISLAYEDREERTEGLANYVAYKITGDISPILRGSSGLVKDKNLVAKSLKWRFYTTGFAMAMMLDEEGIQWKKEAEETPLIYLFKQRDFTQDRLVKTLKILQQYGYESLKNEAKEESLRIQKVIQSEKRAFEHLEGILVEIEHKTPLMSGGHVFSMVKLEDGSTLYKNSSELAHTGEWRLGLRGKPYIWVHANSHFFKERENILLELDGKKMFLKELKEGSHPFKRIAWEGKESKFESKKEGVLICNKEKVTLTFVD